MADVNVNAPAGQAPTMAPPMRTDDQILPHIRWVTPVNDNQAFTSPPSSDALINFVNELGYPKLVRNLSNVVSNDMLQPWRALTTIINLCLTGKTSGFEMPRAPVLQILWGVITRAHVDYAERITEESTQSIHTFIDDKRNLARHTHAKKKATLIVIPSIRFTKLIVYHLQRKHKFHPKPDSSLHLPNEEPVLGYLKFSAKETKREVFRMPIPGSLITSDIQKASYYQEYLAKWPSIKDPRPSVSKLVSTKQPEPKSAPAKTQRKKRKLTTEISDKPSKAMKSRPGLVSKKRKPLSSLRSVDESVAEDVPAKEPRVEDKEADMQRALEESLKSVYDVPRVSLPSVVIREPKSEKYQPLPEVPGKGKEKLTEEQLGLTDSEEESKEVVPGADARGQGKGQVRPDPGAQDVGQAGSNPNEQAEGQAGPDPGNTEESQPIPSPVVHAGSDLEHMDLDVVDVTPQPQPEQMDEGFTATAYLKVQENLKLTVEEQVLLEEPASSSGTLSSLQHLTKDLIFGDLFFSDKPSEAENDKVTADTKVESMVSVTIQQDMSSIPLMTTPTIDLTSRPESPKVHQLLKATTIETTTTTTTTTTILPPPSQQQSTADAMMMKRIGELEHNMANMIQEVSKAVNEVVTDVVDWAMQALLRNRFRDLPEVDMKEILHQHLAEARKEKKKSRESPKTSPGSPPHQPPPLPPPAGPFEASGSPGAFGSSQVLPPHPPPPSTNQESQSKGSALHQLIKKVSPRDLPHQAHQTVASAEYQAWTTTDIRLRPSISLTPADLQIDEDMAPDEQAQSSDDEDIRNAILPKVNLRQDWWKPLKEEQPATSEPAWSISSSDVPVPTNNWASALASNYSPPPEDSLLAQTGDINMFMDWFCKRRGITELKPQDLEGPAFEIIKVFHPDVINLQYQMEECHKLLTDSVDDSILRHNVSKPLPLGGPPGQVTIKSDFFFNKDLEYLRYHSKGSRPALSFSKMKAAYYRDVELEQIVPDQMWIEEECKYDIAAIYEDFQLGIKSCQTQLNLNKPRWDATGFEYKHDYTVIDSLRAVTFRNRYGVQMIMRFNEIHKFSDGTLQQIDEALDYRVKEFKINRMNPGLDTRFWTTKDVDRSKEFMFSIQKRLKTKRIFCNLERFVGRRVRDGDYRLLKRTE
nr:monodehydroascorbate reductase [Tanacetum cinerariifolium]